jgi:hypothetical protein
MTNKFSRNVIDRRPVTRFIASHPRSGMSWVGADLLTASNGSAQFRHFSRAMYFCKCCFDLLPPVEMSTSLKAGRALSHSVFKLPFGIQRRNPSDVRWRKTPCYLWYPTRRRRHAAALFTLHVYGCGYGYLGCHCLLDLGSFTHVHTFFKQCFTIFIYSNILYIIYNI